MGFLGNATAAGAMQAGTESAKLRKGLDEQARTIVSILECQIAEQRRTNHLLEQLLTRGGPSQPPPA